jgi:hypothetical protein
VITDNNNTIKHNQSSYNNRFSAVSDIALILSRPSHMSFQLRIQSGGRVGLYFVPSSMTFCSVPPTLLFNHPSRPFAHYASSFCSHTIVALSSSFDYVLATRPTPFTLEVTVILVTGCLTLQVYFYPTSLCRSTVLTVPYGTPYSSCTFHKVIVRYFSKHRFISIKQVVHTR